MKERVTSITQSTGNLLWEKGDVVLEKCWWECEWKYIHSLGTVEIKHIKCAGNEGSMLVNDLELLIVCELCGMKMECASLISDFDCRSYFVSLLLIFCFGIQLNPIISDWVLNLGEATCSWRKMLQHRTHLSFSIRKMIEDSYFRTKKELKPRRLACRCRAYLLTPLSAHNSLDYQITWMILLLFFQAHQYRVDFSTDSQCILNRLSNCLRPQVTVHNSMQFCFVQIWFYLCFYLIRQQKMCAVQTLNSCVL